MIFLSSFLLLRSLSKSKYSNAAPFRATGPVRPKHRPAQRSRSSAAEMLPVSHSRKRDLSRRMNQPFSVSDLLGYYSPSIQNAGGEQPDRTLDLNILYYRSSWRCLQTKKSRPDRAGRENFFIAAGRSAGLNSCRAKCRFYRHPAGAHFCTSSRSPMMIGIASVWWLDLMASIYFARFS